MMNKIKYIYLVLVSVLIFSCSEEWLEEKPNTFISPENTYTTEAGIEKALGPLYRKTLDYYGARAWTKGGNDVMWTTINTSSGSKTLDTYAVGLNPSTGTFNGWWTSCYNVISKANFILDYVDKVNWSSDAVRGQLEGEARFFRAFYYHQAVITWGDVPLVTEPVSEPKTSYLRNSVDDIYPVMVADLLVAVEGLSDTPPQKGRITRGAAMHLLTTVYLEMGEYLLAENMAKDLISDPNYFLITERYGVKADQPGTPFADMFMDENCNIEDGNTENFWLIQYGPRTDNKWEVRPGTSKQAWMLDYQKIPGLIYSNENFQRGKYRIRVSPYWLSLFEPGDDRISESAVKQTWTINDPKYVSDQQALGNMIELGDTIFMDPANPVIQNYYWPLMMKFVGLGNWTTDPTETATEGDIAVYRLGETYLLLAEALWRQNKVDEAADYINILRQRSNASDITGSDVNADFILDERARELVAEEDRWATLNRFGKLIERVQAYGETDAAANISTKHLLMPIPQNEIDLNKDAVLVQNPGYVE